MANSIVSKVSKPAKFAPPDGVMQTAIVEKLAHDLSCVNGIELGGGLDALKALIKANDDDDTPAFGMEQFVNLLDLVRSKMQDAKNTMEGLIADLEKAVAHG